MGLASEASKLLTNKYFLYFMVFLSASNVLGYLVTHRLRAAAFFGLVGFLTYQFSKNMSVVLLVALIATNFMMSNRMMREGLENADKKALETIESKDPEIAATLPIVKGAKNNDEVKSKLAAAKASGKTKETANEAINTALSDVNNTDLNATTTEENAPEGYENKTAGSKKKEHFGNSRLDFASTIEQSYQNLDSVLGSDSIKQLTNDTRQLMQQQQTLFNTMNQMVPVLEGAQNMLQKFDVAGISESLKNMGSIAKAPSIASKPK
jgi:Tfp pilus assembly protein PilV